MDKRNQGQKTTCAKLEFMDMLKVNYSMNMPQVNRDGIYKFLLSPKMASKA
jgi:hypothetical protein